MAFRVGQKVVCVRDDRYPGEPGPYIVKDAIYTISNIFEDDVYWRGALTWRTMLHFVELPVVEFEDWSSGHDATFFRPVASTDTGMAILNKIRRDVERKVKAPADEQV